MRVRIEGHDLPGRRCQTDAVHDNVHVGVQCKQEVVELVAGDAESARWSVDVTARVTEGGGIDVGGPFVHGKRGDRFLYLSWGTVSEAGEFAMFRRAKLHFADIDPALLAEAASDDKVLVGSIGLTDGRGEPRCARVRPPDVVWSVGSSQT